MPCKNKREGGPRVWMSAHRRYGTPAVQTKRISPKGISQQGKATLVFVSPEVCSKER